MAPLAPCAPQDPSLAGPARDQDACCSGPSGRPSLHAQGPPCSLGPQTLMGCCLSLQDPLLPFSSEHGPSGASSETPDSNS